MQEACGAIPEMRDPAPKKKPKGQRPQSSPQKAKFNALPRENGFLLTAGKTDGIVDSPVTLT